MAVALPSPSSLLTAIALTLVLAGQSLSLQAETSLTTANHYVARLELRAPEELEAALDRVEAAFSPSEQQRFPRIQPVSFVLHGDEINVFRSKNYQRYQQLVDRTARLVAFQMIDVQICETWLRTNGVERSELPVFVDTVPVGIVRENKLMSSGSRYF